MLYSLLFQPGSKIIEIFGIFFCIRMAYLPLKFDADLHQIYSSPEISCLLIFESQIPAGN